MNSDTMETAEQIAKDNGAIVACPICGSYDICADDDEADRMTYAQATNDWRAGVRGFRGMSREDVMGVVKSVLDDALISCPGCKAPMDA